jgi:hypothetical protein
MQNLCDALELVGVVPFVSQDDIDDMVVDAFSRPNGSIACVQAQERMCVLGGGGYCCHVPDSRRSVVWMLSELGVVCAHGMVVTSFTLCLPVQGSHQRAGFSGVAHPQQLRFRVL